MPEILSSQSATHKEDGWEYILSLPIEERFAHRAGVRAICSLIWEAPPELIEINGNTIAVHQLGPEDGVPILSFHGTPGTARGPHPTSALLEAENIRLIAFDAPGFGESAFIPTNTPFVTAGHIAKNVIDAIGYERVGVFARSGGVPRALGFAALYSEHISSMVLVGGPAPLTTEIDWLAGMGTHNQEAFTNIEKVPHLVTARHKQTALQLKENESYLFEELWPEMSEFDKIIFELQPDLAVCTAAGHAMGLRDSTGWTENVAALRRPWGFDFQDIQTPTLIIQGNDDPFTTLEHAKWLHTNIQEAELLEVDGGHFTNWLQIRKTLAYLREKHLESLSGAEKIGKVITAATMNLEKTFKLRSCYDNYVES